MSDLAVRARGLIDFALQSIEEALSDTPQAAECFGEADDAINILRKTLIKEDEFRHAQLMLMSIFDTSFVRISTSDNQSERECYLREATERLTFAKTLFEP